MSAIYVVIVRALCDVCCCLMLITHVVLVCDYCCCGRPIVGVDTTICVMCVDVIIVIHVIVSVSDVMTVMYVFV